MPEPPNAFGRFLRSFALAGVIIISPLPLIAQDNPVTAGLASANPATTPETPRTMARNHRERILVANFASSTSTIACPHSICRNCKYNSPRPST